MICVDASVAAKWVLQEDYSQEADALVRACIAARERVTAPPFLPVEVTNIVRRRMVQQGLALADARIVLRQFLAFPVALMAPVGLYEEALALADAFGLPAVYDAHYVALAQHLGCDLWTDDRRLLRALGANLPFVKWIGEFRR